MLRPRRRISEARFRRKKALRGVKWTKRTPKYASESKDAERTHENPCAPTQTLKASEASNMPGPRRRLSEARLQRKMALRGVKWTKRGPKHGLEREENIKQEAQDNIPFQRAIPEALQTVETPHPRRRLSEVRLQRKKALRGVTWTKRRPKHDPRREENIKRENGESLCLPNQPSGAAQTLTPARALSAEMSKAWQTSKIFRAAVSWKARISTPATL